MTELTEAARAFIEYLRSARRLSAHTLSAYQRELAVLHSRLAQSSQSGGGKTPMQATATDIRRLISADRACAPATVSRRLAAWRMFFDYLVEQKLIAANPARGILSPKNAAALPKSLTPDEVAALFRAPVAADDWLGQRDRAMMELFYSSGLRLSELSALNVSDVDFTADVVYVRAGKGAKDRVAPLGQSAKTALKKWLVLRGRLPKKNTGTGRVADAAALFLSSPGRRLSVRMIQQRLADAARRAGLQKPLSPHILRHSCASHFLQSSRDLRATQELLGHRNIATTQIYTRLDYQHLAKTYDRAHPRAKQSSAKSR